MVRIKLSSVVPVALLGVFLSMSVQAENNRATVIIDNKTNAVAAYTYEHMSGSAGPPMANVDAMATARFIVTSFADSLSGMRFVYASGTKKCRFNVSHTAPFPSYIPTWKKEATSIGTAKAVCAVAIEKIDSNMPYHYTVKFTIQ